MTAEFSSDTPRPDRRYTGFHDTATALADLVRSVVVDAPRAATLEAVDESAVGVSRQRWSPAASGTGDEDLRAEVARLAEAVSELRERVDRLAAMQSKGSSVKSSSRAGRRAKR